MNDEREEGTVQTEGTHWPGTDRSFTSHIRSSFIRFVREVKEMRPRMTEGTEGT